MSLNLNEIYVDNAATTPVSEEVLNEMLPFFTKNYGNPSGLYMLSQESKAAIEFARDKVASVINSKASEIIFTSGGTESNNLALKGFCKPRIENDQDEIIISSIEHHAIIHPSEQLANIGYKTIYCNVDDNGQIKVKEFENLISKKTKLVSIIFANNEIGSVQNIKELVEIVRKKENELQLNLVYNPVSPILPPSQEILEKDYKKILFEKYNIVFNNLYTITNMPINRYEESLRREGKLNAYCKLLKENFNEKNLENLMCKKTISVNWLGEIYDCDFNQQINFREDKGPKTLFDLLDESFTFDYGVAVKEHCFACTAGAGSSCGGTLS